MAQLRPKIVKLAKIIGGVTGITTRIDENAPEYYCMAGILTDEEADVAIAAGLRGPAAVRVSELDEAGRRAHRVAERPLLFSAVGTDLAAGLELVDEGLGAHDVHIRLAHVAAVPAKDHIGRKAVIDAAGAFFLFLGGQRPGIDVLIDCHRLLLPCQIWCSRLTLS